jgi:hypothetical protein
MQAIVRRLCKLEDRFGSPDKSRHHFRLVFSSIGREESLEDATCRRTFWPNGTLFEMVNLKGSKEGHGRLSDEELDRWVESFPIR